MLHVPRVFKRKARYVGDGIKPGDYGKVAARNIRSERMTSSVSLPFMEDAVLYDANTMGVERRRQRRSDRHQQPAIGKHDTGRVPPVGREGLSGPAALAALACLAFVLLVIGLVDFSGVVRATDELHDTETRIADVQLANEGLELKLAARASEVNVGYEAVQMGMISAKGVDVIYLNAPEEAQMTPPTGPAKFSSDYLATILGD